MLKTQSSKGIGNLLIRNTALNFTGQLAPMLVGIFTIPFIIHSLGIEGFGILSLSWVIMGNLTIFNLGISRAVTKFMAESLGKNEIHTLPHIVWNSVYFQAVLGIIGGLLLAIFSPYLVTKVFKIPTDHVIVTIRIFYLLAASLPFMLLSETFSGVLQAAQRFDLVNAVKIPISIAAFLVPAIALIFGANLFDVVVILLMSKVAGFFAYLMLCIWAFPVLRSDFSVHPRKLGVLLVFGGWLTVSNVLSPIFIYFERFFIVSLLSVGMLTFYSAPFEMISRIIIFPASIALTIFPFFSYYGKDNVDVLGKVFFRSLKLLIFVMTPVAVFFFAFANDVLRLWLGHEFAAQSTVLFQVLTAAFFINTFAYIPLTAIQGLGRADLNAKLEIVLAPIFVTLLYIMIRAFGLNGAALAKLVVGVLDAVVLFWFSERVGGFSVKKVFFDNLKNALVISVALIGTLFLLPACHGLVAKTSVFTAFTFLYVFLFWKRGFDITDKKFIESFIKRGQY